MARKYHIALSFSGKDRQYVKEVNSQLKSANVRTFYDEDHEVENWGQNLAKIFHEVYEKQSHFVAIFASRAYLESAFAKVEKDHALSNYISLNQKSILVGKFENIEIPGYPNTNLYLDLTKYNPAEFSKKIVEKLRLENLLLSPVKNQSHVEPLSVTKRRQDEKTTIVKTASQDGSPIAQADVCVIRSNGTRLHCKSDDDGRASFAIQDRTEICTIMIAHREFPSTTVEEHEMSDHLEVKISRKGRIGSTAFLGSTGHIPGIVGRLSPILDSAKRTYLYADNVAINGSVFPQPRNFQCGENINLEDCNGGIAGICIQRIYGNCVLIDYITEIQ